MFAHQKQQRIHWHRRALVPFEAGPLDYIIGTANSYPPRTEEVEKQKMGQLHLSSALRTFLNITQISELCLLKKYTKMN